MLTILFNLNYTFIGTITRILQKKYKTAF